jgi:hypothetical protein
MSDEMRRASHLFEAYFHQDCLDDDPNWESIVLRFRDSEPFEIVRQTQSELTVILDRSSEVDLERFLFGSEFRSSYDPRPEGLTLRSWFEGIIHLLAGGSADRPDRSVVPHGRRKAVEIARRVLTEGDDPILAARELCALRHSIGIPRDDADFTCFVAIDSETDGIPVGQQRKLWSPESWARLEPEVTQAREWAMTVGREAFQNVVRRFSSTG